MTVYNPTAPSNGSSADGTTLNPRASHLRDPCTRANEKTQSDNEIIGRERLAVNNPRMAPQFTQRRFEKHGSPRLPGLTGSDACTIGTDVFRGRIRLHQRLLIRQEHLKPLRTPLFSTAFHGVSLSRLGNRSDLSKARKQGEFLRLSVNADQAKEITPITQVALGFESVSSRNHTSQPGEHLHFATGKCLRWLNPRS